MEVKKQSMPAHIEAALPELLADIIRYLDLEESDEFSVDDLKLDGYYAAGPSIAFLAYDFPSDDGESAFAAIKLNPKGRSFQDAAVFSWGREKGQSTEQALADFLEMNPHL